MNVLLKFLRIFHMVTRNHQYIASELSMRNWLSGLTFFDLNQVSSVQKKYFILEEAINEKYYLRRH